MVLSSDELEVLEYLKSWSGKFVSLVEISRCAGGRRKFKESPNWAKPLMLRLVDSKLIEVNERGHYRRPPEDAPPETQATMPVRRQTAVIIGDNYFPAQNREHDDQEPGKGQERWIAPHIAAILQSKGKKPGPA